MCKAMFERLYLLGSDYFEYQPIKTCSSVSAERFGLKFQIVNTPNFFDNDVCQEKANEIVKCLALTSPGPHCFLIVIDIDCFGEMDMVSIEQSFNFFGEAMKDFTIFILTSDMEEEIICKMLDDNKCLQDMVSQCKGRWHAFSKSFPLSERIKPLVESMKKLTDGKKHFENKETKEVNKVIKESTAQLEEQKKADFKKKEESAEKLRRSEEQIQKLTEEKAAVEAEKNLEIEKLNNEVEKLKNENKKMKEDNSTLPKDDKSSTSSKKAVVDAVMPALATVAATAIAPKFTECITKFAKGIKKK